ncbi:hypothetical protein FQB35_00875 [Crassaminicella thermophila]|uniref:Uncharacterized protein n=1 Tax=Crassaminicella thermophila TaxID=2599308 RepID=A0A5C0SDM7_CRATE|nr:hypothetical protein [Crassaminicella thermophila]QEK11039.1 hypothetical protein FQB35_00875 [Crassaminicella thermophila]
MDYLIHFFSAWISFIGPMSVLNIKTTYKQQFLYTFILGSVAIISRSLYQWIQMPFGVHTIIYIVTAVFLMKKIIKSLSLVKTILIVWVSILIIIITEIIVTFPLQVYFGISLTNAESNPVLVFLLGGIGSNIGLIFMWLIGKYVRKNKKVIS